MLSLFEASTPRKARAFALTRTCCPGPTRRDPRCIDMIPAHHQNAASAAAGIGLRHDESVVIRGRAGNSRQRAAAGWPLVIRAIHRHGASFARRAAPAGRPADIAMPVAGCAYFGIGTISRGVAGSRSPPAPRRTGGTYMRSAEHSRRWFLLRPQARNTPAL